MPYVYFMPSGNDINLIVYALLRKAKYMIAPVPNRGNQSFRNEPINHQLYEITGKTKIF